jgi:hypothetical protein
MRQLKHHEQKLLKKVNFLQWKSEHNMREVQVMRRYHIQNRDDYKSYNKICGHVTKLTAVLRKLDSRDPVRIELTDKLLDKCVAGLLFWLANQCIFHRYRVVKDLGSGLGKSFLSLLLNFRQAVQYGSAIDEEEFAASGEDIDGVLLSSPPGGRDGAAENVGDVKGGRYIHRAGMDYGPPQPSTVKARPRRDQGPVQHSTVQV